MTTIHDFGARRDREANTIAVVLALPCGVACAGSVASGLDEMVTAVAVVLVVLAALGLLGHRVARWVRERREDTADTLTAARWRAVHAPHLLTTTDHAHLTRHAHHDVRVGLGVQRGVRPAPVPGCDPLRNRAGVA